MVPLATVNTRNILFICGGAFPDLDEIIKERLTKTASIGFNSELKDKYDKDTDILSKVTVEDIRKFGMIPEFIGRLPIICTLQGLSKDMLVKILKEPKNAILKQYQKLLEKMRALMDEELLENNPQDTFSTQMQNDIAAYKAESKIIATASVCDTDEVAYKKVEGSDCAYVTASYFLRSTKAYNRANQEYVLRKDENGDWKILGFVALEGDNGDAEK